MLRALCIGYQASTGPIRRLAEQVTRLSVVLSEEKKRGRTRKRKPLTEEDRAKVKKIQEITEYYFTSEGLGKNTRLRQRVVGNVDGFVPLDVVANQKRIRAVTTQKGIIIAGILRSRHLLFDRRQGVRSRKPIRNLARTAPAKGLAMSEYKLVLVVAAALIDGKGQVLLAQRPEGRSMAGLWEFPGGKVDQGERPEQALIRELDEELGIKVKFEDLKPLTFASHAYDTFHLLMPLFECSRWEGEPQGREGQRIAWVSANELEKYDMPQADQPLITPVQAAVARLASSVIAEFS